MSSPTKLILLASTLLSFWAHGQVTLDPYFASQDDTVTIVYDATEGNGALQGHTEVYLHTGVITTESSGPTDWKFVQGVWGTANPAHLMTSQGNDIFTFEMHIPTFYGFPSGTEVLELAFVFRNADGSIVGRSATGGDIFVPLFQGFGATLLSPAEDVFIIDSHGTYEVEAITSDPAHLSILIDDSTVATDTNGTSLTYSLETADFGPGKHFIIMEAVHDGQTYRDSSYYIFREPTVYEALPTGIKDGANYINDSTVVLKLTVPYKEFAFVIGDFNDWELDDAYLMKRSLDSSAFWIELTGLVPDVEYRYQFAVGEDLIRIADPYTHKILDPWNDPWIPETTYPDLIDYPTGKTNEAVSILHINRPKFQWDTTFSYERPAQEDLIIYELLIRDFTTERTYQSVIDSLDYLEGLGINAIELMPVNEFEGNDSWGYNPSFYFAPDKYYGTEEKLKELIEEAHKRGIAIILDMVLNHSFGQSPLVRLFFDGSTNQPTEENPWFLQSPAHDFNVGYDFDHESEWTRKFVDDVMRFWVEEYRIDGYRMDLSKGFTNNVTIGNVGAWGQYDASRVYNLTRMADELWAVDSTAYIILEHFANNDEEKELASLGFMLWGNSNHDFNECTMGYGSNVSWSSYKNRDWSEPHLISYMESHDEERLMYKNQEFGKEVEGYSTRKPWTALKRMEAAAVYFLSTPGPKMIWQFGEFGYDLSINRCENGTISEGCRLSPKPPRWNYLQSQDRQRLLKVYSTMNALRAEHDAFRTNDFSMAAGGQVKTISLDGDAMDVFTIVNFDVVAKSGTYTFPHTGTWYELFSGDSLNVTSASAQLDLERGEYRLYTDVKLEQPDLPAGVDATTPVSWSVFPNPTSGMVHAASTHSVKRLEVIDVHGRTVWSQSSLGDGSETVDMTPLESGIYVVRAIFEDGTSAQQRVVKH